MVDPIIIGIGVLILLIILKVMKFIGKMMFLGFAAIVIVVVVIGKSLIG